MAFPTGWNKKHKIKIDHTKVSGSANLTNFPVLLTEANFLSSVFDNTQTTGADLRFTSDEAGTTELCFEIVNWDTTNDKAEVWVKIPTLSYTTDTNFYVWYDNDSATAYAADATYGSQAVWADYEGVWHLTDTTDSSASGYDLTLGAGGQAPTSTSGLLGTTTDGAYDFEISSSQYMYNNTVPNLRIAGNQTWTAWIKPEAVGLNRIAFVCTAAVGEYAGISTDDATKDALSSISDIDKSNSMYKTTLSAGNNYYIAGQLDSNNKKHRCYLNGDLGQDLSYTGSHTAGSTSVFAIGKLGAYAQYCDGIIDEVRVTTMVLTEGWLTTEYNNQSSPATFATPIAGFVPKVIFIS